MGYILLLFKIFRNYGLFLRVWSCSIKIKLYVTCRFLVTNRDRSSLFPNMLSLDIVSWLALSMFSGFLLLFWFDHQKKWTQKLAFLTETSGDSFPLTPGLSDLPLRGTRVMTQTLCPLIGRRWERGSIHESKPCNLWVLGTVLLLTRCRLFPLRCSGCCRIARV